MFKKAVSLADEEHAVTRSALEDGPGLVVGREIVGALFAQTGRHRFDSGRQLPGQVAALARGNLDPARVVERAVQLQGEQRALRLSAQIGDAGQ